MLHYVVVSLLLIGGTDAFHDCDESIHRVCRENDIPDKFPTTAAQLQDICRPTIEFIECGIAFSKKCNKQLDELEAAEAMLSVLQDACNADTLLHGAIVENLKCFDEMIKEKDRTCVANPLTREAAEEYADVLVERGLFSVSEHGNISYSSYQCIRLAHGVACEALKIENRCGGTAMGAMLEIIHKLAPAIDLDCNELADILPVMIDLYRLENEKKIEIAEALKKKK